MIERLNPVAVKEVRQALRGRVFRLSFLITLSIATLVSVGALMSRSGSSSGAEFGDEFFALVFPCLLAALLLIVPFQAYAAMGSEWEENTWDLLVLSNLKPGRILIGKLLGALAQALLMLSAFLPYLVFAYILRGLDLTAVVLLVALALFASLALSVLALWVSGLVTKRFGRVVLLALLAAGLVFATMGSIGFSIYLVSEPQDIQREEFRVALGIFLACVALMAAILFAASCARLSHPEENRSSALRCLLLLAVLVAMGLAVWFYPLIGQPEAVYAIASSMPAFLVLPFVFLLTEPDRLGRRVALQVPRSRVLALLSFPLQPGGARALVLLVLFAALLFAGSWLLVFSLHGPPNWPSMAGPIPGFLFPDQPWSGRSNDEMAVVMMVLWSYFLLYLSAASLAVSWLTRAMRGRILARLLLVTGWLGVVFGPMFFGFLIGDRDLTQGRHYGNPFWVIDQATSSSRAQGVRSGVATVVLLMLVALLLNVPRVVKALRETLAASRLRRQHEGGERSSAPPASAGALPAPAAVPTQGTDG